jgi:hypothetical protein
MELEGGKVTAPARRSIATSSQRHHHTVQGFDRLFVEAWIRQFVRAGRAEHPFESRAAAVACVHSALADAIRTTLALEPVDETS